MYIKKEELNQTPEFLQEMADEEADSESKESASPKKDIPEELVPYLEKIKLWINKFFPILLIEERKAALNPWEDSVALHFATHYWASSNMLPVENLVHARGLLQAVRHFFPESAHFITKSAQASSIEIEKGVTDFIDSFHLEEIFKKIEELVQKYAPVSFYNYYKFAKMMFFDRPWIKDFPKETFELLERMESFLQLDVLTQEGRAKLQVAYYAIQSEISQRRNLYLAKQNIIFSDAIKTILAFKNKENKDGNFFETMREMHEHESQAHFYKELASLSKDRRFSDMSYVHEMFSRGNLWSNYCEAIMVEINNGQDRRALSLFDNMIEDLISAKPRGIWLHGSEKSFLHHFDVDLVRSRFERNHPVKIASDIVIENFEDLVNDIKIIFIDNVDPTNTNFDYNIWELPHLNPIQNNLRRILLLEYEIILIQNFLKDSHLFGGENNLFFVEIKERLKKMLKFDVSNRDSYTNILYNIHLYPYTIVHKLYSPNEMHSEVHRESLKYRRDPELFIRHFHSIKDEIIADIKAEMSHFLNFIEVLFRSRRGGVSNFEAVFCMGFSGPIFNNLSVSSEQNLIHLAFSKSLGSGIHLLFLKHLARRLESLDWSKTNIGVRPIINPISPVSLVESKEDELASDYPSRSDITDTRKVTHFYMLEKMRKEKKDFDAIAPFPVKDKPSVECKNYANSDKAVYLYVLEKVMELIFLKKNSVDLNEEFKKTFLFLINQVINQSILNHHPQSKELKILKEKLSNLPLEYQDYILLKKIVLNEQAVSCAESLVSRYGHTNVYVPVTFKPKQMKKEAAGEAKEGAPIYIGVGDKKRLLVPPCSKCQLLSAAYMLWGSMTKKWDINQLQEIARLTSKPPIPVRLMHPDQSTTPFSHLLTITQSAVSLTLDEQEEKQLQDRFQAQKQNYNDPAIHEALIYLYLQANNIRGAIAHSRIALNLLQGQAAVDTRRLTNLYHNLGCFYHSYACEQQRIGRVEQSQAALLHADTQFKLGIASTPHVGIRTEYAKYLLQQQRIPEAITLLEGILSSPQKDVTQEAEELSYTLCERLALDPVLQTELDFWQKFSLRATTLAHYLLITAYVQQGKLELAIKTIRLFESLALTEKNPLTFSLLGYVQQLVKDYKGAAISYQQALNLKPDYTVAQQASIQVLKNLPVREKKSADKDDKQKNENPCPVFLEDRRQEFQLSWNCFDLAVRLDEAFNITDPDPHKRAQATRNKLMTLLLEEKHIPRFRRLLVPEIFHAAGSTAAYLNAKKDKENTDKKRNARIAELFGISDALMAINDKDKVASQGMVTGQITELLGKGDNHSSDFELEELRRNILPPTLQTEELRLLVNAYQDADDVMQNHIRTLCGQYPQVQTAVAVCKQALSQAQNNRVILSVSAEELYQFLQKPEQQKQYPVAWGVYSQCYQESFARHEQALQTYCESDRTYRAYINDYYGRHGWIAFQRSFKAEGAASTSMVDIVAYLLNTQIIVYQNNEEIYRTAAIESQPNKKIYIQFNGRDHFIALRGNPLYAAGLVNNIRDLGIFRVTPSAGIVNEDIKLSAAQKNSTALAKARVEVTADIAIPLINSFFFTGVVSGAASAAPVAAEGSQPKSTL